MDEETLSKANSLCKQKNRLEDLIISLNDETYNLTLGSYDHIFDHIFSDDEHENIKKYIKKQAKKKLKSVQEELESL